MSDSFIRVDELLPKKHRRALFRELAAVLLFAGVLIGTGAYLAESHNLTITIEP